MQLEDHLLQEPLLLLLLLPQRLHILLLRTPCDEPRARLAHRHKQAHDDDAHDQARRARRQKRNRVQVLEREALAAESEQRQHEEHDHDVQTAEQCREDEGARLLFAGRLVVFFDQVDVGLLLLLLLTCGHAEGCGEAEEVREGCYGAHADDQLDAAPQEREPDAAD